MLYYQAPHRVAVLVSEAVNQWALLDSTTMIILYPDKQLAFRIQTGNLFVLPFFQAFLGIAKEEFGLADDGFVLSRNEVRGDTLVTFWTPPKELKRQMRSFVLAYVENRICFNEIISPQGRAVARSEFSDYFPYGDGFFPQTIHLRQQRGRVSTIERVSLWNPQFDVTLPDSVVAFMRSPIPDSVEVKEVKW